MISKKLPEQIKEAMKAKDKMRLSTLKMLSAALHNAEIAKRPDKMSEEDELEVVGKEAKKRKDAIEAYEKAGAIERAEKEKKELAILQKYLPKGLSDDEIGNLVDEAISQTKAESLKDMGKVIGMVMGKAKGRADGKKVSELVKAKLG